MLQRINRQQRNILFKSIPEYWIKEKMNIKRNTVRFIDNDIRFHYLNQFIKGDINLMIGIKNTLTNEVFYREVKDVTLWEGLYIISW